MAKGHRRDVVPSKSLKGWDVTKPGAKEAIFDHRKLDREMGVGSAGRAR
jgi:hypothetical protein